MCMITVIVPVYQVEQYLGACIDSLLIQSLSDYECIFVDDGTMDSSCEIIEKMVGGDARFRLIHKKNGGLSSARNAGLEIANGKYVAFLDSDDTAHPDWLRDTVECAEAHSSDMVLYNYCKVEKGVVYDPFLPIQDEEIDIGQMGLPNYFYHYWMPYRHGQEAWSRIYRRDLIEDHHIRFQPNDRIFAEDTLFSAMAMMHAHHISALGKAYIYYLQRGDSLMGKPKPRLAKRLMQLSVDLWEYAEKTGHGKELQNVLPVLCYDKLICKGIRFDPSLSDVLDAMAYFAGNETMKTLLRRLESPAPLLLYTMKTGQGFRTQIRGRLFASNWLRGKYKAAADLVEGKIGV